MGNVTAPIYLEEACLWIHPISGGAPPPVSCPPPPPPPPPPAEPHIVATPPGARSGSMWVEGAELHYIAGDGVEYAETGTSVATPPGAIVGSYWIESPDVLYVDASGVKRRISKTSLGAKPAPAIIGSNWEDTAQPEGRQIEWIEATNRYQWWNGL